MKAIKCDRCGAYFDENRDPNKTGIAFVDEDGDVQGPVIDLCDNCIGTISNWFEHVVKEEI